MHNYMFKMTGFWKKKEKKSSIFFHHDIPLCTPTHPHTPHIPHTPHCVLEKHKNNVLDSFLGLSIRLHGQQVGNPSSTTSHLKRRETKDAQGSAHFFYL
jgi:hypothetical protein